MTNQCKTAYDLKCSITWSKFVDSQLQHSESEDYSDELENLEDFAEWITPFTYPPAPWTELEYLISEYQRYQD